jgi:hypothetical protein
VSYSHSHSAATASAAGSAWTGADVVLALLSLAAPDGALALLLLSDLDFEEALELELAGAEAWTAPVAAKISSWLSC